ncbi:CRISPR-associated endonuclease Cas2 [Arcicella aquatica]|uniref:CRISPR-associated endoribonuclease Cas2 n=1 Tax=Arcicella aquatica TaxID=217141 RepID=A0ABU5QR32_9BACT|nr:CRISPR-associated endonuclease Cas2 [Arcicella aquatica]MEA5259546.1 CRISPR-associated endonuclease Cas2 [Arcicella aquatica]
MPRKKAFKPKPLATLNQEWEKAALPFLPEKQLSELTSVENQEKVFPDGLKIFFDFLKNTQKLKRSEDMYCFIMYDIENTKIRNMMAKYLIQKGCIRVQKSIYFARFHRKLQKEVTDMLRKMQACYENQDSILVLPVGEDMLNSLTCIGKSFELKLITAPKHTMFF